MKKLLAILKKFQMFETFGFIVDFEYKQFGVWLGSITYKIPDYVDEDTRSLFLLYYIDGSWYLDIFWKRIIGEV